jgi:hypothetical protein
VISPQGYPADAGKVTVMLESLRNLTLSALISSRKATNGTASVMKIEGQR